MRPEDPIDLVLNSSKDDGVGDGDGGSGSGSGSAGGSAGQPGDGGSGSGGAGSAGGSAGSNRTGAAPPIRAARQALWPPRVILLNSIVLAIGVIAAASCVAVALCCGELAAQRSRGQLTFSGVKRSADDDVPPGNRGRVSSGGEAFVLLFPRGSALPDRPDSPRPSI